MMLVVAGCGGTSGESLADGDQAAQLCLPPACGTTVPFEATDGFVGPMRDIGASDATVMVDSLTVSTAGDWWALGLVSGAAGESNSVLAVTAELRNDRGAVVATVSSNVLVAPLRAGEPGPFRIEAPGVASGDVTEVTWSVANSGSFAPVSARAMAIDVFWSRPAGGRPVDVVGYADDGGVGTPLVTYVGVVSTGAEAVVSPGVVAAWLDGSGRVLAVATADVLEPGRAVPSGVLEPGAAADAVLVLDDPIALSLANVVPLLWAVGRS